MFFVCADSKEVTGENSVSADSKGVTSPLFPTLARKSGSADSPGKHRSKAQRSEGAGLHKDCAISGLVRLFGPLDFGVGASMEEKKTAAQPRQESG